ncbi:UMP-CMP kinase [Teratosphaeria destructans]|uniref:UMP-CMP kinase n=1 Tax=Teratosphaeria destructans TaxID=418781 RepID=A0A9W7SXC2_9PEZI|nr:UMP-CMP kinase [Teratosphaeria destructans]
MSVPASDQPAANAFDIGPKVEIVFVIGPPGSGKGTHCKRLASEAALGIYHLSAGDYLRDISNGEVAIEEGMLGDMPYDDFRAHLEKSKLLPGPTVARILAHKVWKEYENGQRTFLIDGYPRQTDAADEFEKAVTGPRAVVEFCCERESPRSASWSAEEGTTTRRRLTGAMLSILRPLV